MEEGRFKVVRDERKWAPSPWLIVDSTDSRVVEGTYKRSTAERLVELYERAPEITDGHPLVKREDAWPLEVG